jgi:hypothetical protein
MQIRRCTSDKTKTGKSCAADMAVVVPTRRRDVVEDDILVIDCAAPINDDDYDSIFTAVLQTSTTIVQQT